MGMSHLLNKIEAVASPLESMTAPALWFWPCLQYQIRSLSYGKRRTSNQKVVGYSCKGAIIAPCADPAKVLFLTSASTRGQKQQQQHKILLPLLSSPLCIFYVTLFSLVRLMKLSYCPILHMRKMSLRHDTVCPWHYKIYSGMTPHYEVKPGAKISFQLIGKH